MAGQAGGIEDEENGVGFLQIRHAAFEDVVRDLFIFATRLERVDSWEIYEGKGVAGVQAQSAYVALDGDARIVRDFLAEASEAIEKRALAGIWWTDERN
jgi:hypothetical protein